MTRVIPYEERVPKIISSRAEVQCLFFCVVSFGKFRVFARLQYLENFLLCCTANFVVLLRICTSFCTKVTIFGRPFVKRFALCYRTVVCLSCLSVTLVGVLWPNGWMDQDATWYAARPRPRRHCVRLEHSSPTERGTAAPLTFRPMSIVAKRSPISATAELLLLVLIQRLLPSTAFADGYVSQVECPKPRLTTRGNRRHARRKSGRFGPGRGVTSAQTCWWTITKLVEDLKNLYYQQPPHKQRTPKSFSLELRP